MAYVKSRLRTETMSVEIRYIPTRRHSSYVYSHGLIIVYNIGVQTLPVIYVHGRGGSEATSKRVIGAPCA